MRRCSGGRVFTRRIAEVAPLGLLLLAWLWLLVYAYPGLMTMDSTDQLTEARAGFFTDSHPPAMSMLWRVVDALYPGPFGMLLLQSLAFIVGLYIVLRRALSRCAASIAGAILFVFPPVFTPLAAVWKDCLMAGFLLLAVAGLTSARRGARVAGLAACVVAAAIRYNAPAATLPLVVILFTWSPMPAVRRYLLAAGAWVMVTLTAFGIGAALTDQPMYLWQSGQALMDIAGTLSHVDGTLPDDELRDTLAGTQLRVDEHIHAAIRHRYAPRDYSALIGGDGRLWDVPIAGSTPAPQKQRDAITRAFWDVITAHPDAYLRSRLSTMRHVLALTERPAESPVMHHRLQYAPLLAKLDVSAEPSRLQWRWEKRFSHLADRHVPGLFRPWIYLALALVLLTFCRGQRDVAALLLSGIALEATLLLFAASSDFRYSHWLVVSTCVAVVMLVARRIRAPEPCPRSSRPARAGCPAGADTASGSD